MIKPKKLTNEKLKQLYENPFDLVNHAIDLARHMVESGQAITDNHEKNSANNVLKKIVKQKEMEEKSTELIEHEVQASDDKDLPNPMLQAI